MSELPRVELPSLLAQTDQVVRLGGARAVRETVERADRDYELELHTLQRSEEVIEAEAVSSADDQHEHDRGGRHPGGRRSPQEDDHPDDEPHLVDVTA